ncbi:DUF4349 domain-containing protein [Chloroflexota bacterium]
MKKLITVAGLLIVILTMILVACAKAPEPAPSPAPAPMPAPMPAPAAPPPVIIMPGTESSPDASGVAVPKPAPAPAPVMPEEAGGVVDVGQPWSERMIVRTGNMWLVVTDVPLALDQIANLAESSGGYVVSSQRWEEGERLVGNITIRVPSGDYDNAVRALRALAVEVTSENTYSQDVTEEYIDLTAKLHNLEATEEQLLRLLEKAEKVEEILGVQKELSNVRGEIERTKGRMQYLERTSATSLIEVHLEQATLDVSFSADNRRVKEGQRVEFERSIGGGFAPYSFEWDFGDGDTSTSEYPVHTYKTAGSYNVSLKVTDDRGNTDARFREGYITVLPGWSAVSIVRSAWNGLIVFGQVVADIVIWLGIFSPVWIIGGGILYWFWWRKRKKKA